jgi:hypothetical protein
MTSRIVEVASPLRLAQFMWDNTDDTNMKVRMTMSDRNIILRCMRCKNHTRGNRADGWNSIVKNGRMAGHICPVCQTPEESEQAMRRMAGIEPTLRSSTTGEEFVVEVDRETFTEAAKMYAMQLAMYEAQGKS